MIYPQRDNRRKRKKLATTTGIIAGVIILCTILNIWNPNLFTPAIHAVGEPILNARGGFLGGINNAWQFLHSKTQLVHENQALKDKLVLYNALETERDYYKEQNAQLARLATTSPKDKNSVIAKIISKPGFSPYDTMIIDVGKNENINSGDLVLAGKDSILGVVSEIYNDTSTVTLYSTPEKETVVLIGTSSIQAVAKGKGAGNFEVKLPKNTEVRTGDSVIVASSSSKILGKVQVIKDSPTDSFEWALFKNLSDVAALRFVIIEKQ
ncbi:MAG: Rod shape-determining protein MreC [Candidatus Paceibacter sp.]|jgi:cell shape-determining protein MreC|nr:Rod shape-determining protein MreC [Candidatus Paceibacter sp.]